MTSLGYEWRISVASLSQLIPETCEAIISSMKSSYLATPSSEGDWKKISDDMETHWNFPNAIGETRIATMLFGKFSRSPDMTELILTNGYMFSD